MALLFRRHTVMCRIFPSWAENWGELGPDYTTEGFEPLKLLVQVFDRHCNLSDEVLLSRLTDIPTFHTIRLLDQLLD
jgi:hypothetical protein